MENLIGRKFSWETSTGKKGTIEVDSTEGQGFWLYWTDYKNMSWMEYWSFEDFIEGNFKALK